MLSNNSSFSTFKQKKAEIKSAIEIDKITSKYQSEFYSYEDVFGSEES